MKRWFLDVRSRGINSSCDRNLNVVVLRYSVKEGIGKRSYTRALSKSM